ncbi:uncharacterized protein FIBRA_08642 [Fibroporia radiculosa]|uniref:DUF2421 domain-containing protein n=1 Tax=Fibroporia radiculosa TaxID=599839 RepID=J4GHZ1_9APHY|nr:uncharacterized protein FIBRA_08642 [Fibroporia radiculosa]CCM06383.1 predicted protein [Fibroporia radiculosa]
MGPRALKLKACYQSVAQSLLHFGSLYLERRPLARLLSTFLCCLAIVVHPVSRFGGAYAYLVLPFQALIFSVQESLAQQLELTILNLIGALLAIAISTLAKFLASLAPYDSTASRATCAIFLIFISFCAGFVKSRLVRLTVSMRISLFVSTWLLTVNIGDSSKVLSDSGDFLYVTIAPAVLSLAALLIVMTAYRWSSSSFAGDMAASFALLQRCLSVSVEGIQGGQRKMNADSMEILQLQSQLLQRSIILNETYSQAAFELRVGRLSLKSIRPLIGVVEHLRRTLSWGMFATERKPSTAVSSRATSRRGSVRRLGNFMAQPVLLSHEKFISSIEVPALSLGHAIIAALQAVEMLISLSFNQNKSTSSAATSNGLVRLGSGPAKHALHVAEQTLVKARNEARERLEHTLNEMDLEQRALGQNTYYPKEVLDGSLIMIALLQMAQEMRGALQIADRMYTQYEESTMRLWYPRISLAWLGVPPAHIISDDVDATLQLRPAVTTSSWGGTSSEVDLTVAEAKEGLAERGFTTDVRRLPSGLTYETFDEKGKQHPASRKRSPWDILALLFSHLWALPRMIRTRIWLAKLNRTVVHSEHVKHAMKNAIGVAVLSFPAFMPANSAGEPPMVHILAWTMDGHQLRLGFGDKHWSNLESGIPTFGRHDSCRHLCIHCLADLSYEPIRPHYTGYGKVLLGREVAFRAHRIQQAADVPFTWLITRAALPQLAVPAAVALPIVAFAQYVNPGTTTKVVDIAAMRILMITIGIVGALLMNSVVFPRHCRVLFLSETSSTLGLMSALYMALGNDIFRKQPCYIHPQRKRILKLELHIRSQLHRLSALITTMHDEISLLPKPLARYRRIVTLMQRLLDGMTGLRKIRENIPRRETVSNVYNERHEFLSCVCITLYACQHAFRARESLPQFLPSPRHALDNLEEHIQQSIRNAREANVNAMGLSLVYAFAEQEVLRHMVDTLEELLELTGRLFGTSAWMTNEQHMSMASVAEDPGDHAWYSTMRWEEA